MPQSKGRRKSKAVGRPTPPSSSLGKARSKKSSSTYQVIMFGLMGLGVVTVVIRYVLELSGLWLIGGLGAMAAGFAMTINYH